MREATGLDPAHAAWIAAAEADIRTSRSDDDLVPPDHPARAWDEATAVAVADVAGRLATATRGACSRAIGDATAAGDRVSQSRAEQARNRLHQARSAARTAGVGAPDRWLAIGVMCVDATEWLPADAFTEEQRRDLQWLRNLDTERRAVLREAAAEYLKREVATEAERRATAEAWAVEVARRGRVEREREAARLIADVEREAGPLLPDGHVAPPGYTVDRSGVARDVLRQGETVPARVAFGPIVIAGICVGPDGEQWVDLRWWDTGRPVTRRVGRAVTRSGRAMVRILGPYGLPIAEGLAREVERYLGEYEAANRIVLDENRIVLARQLGWQPDGEFVTANGAPYPVEPLDPRQVGLLAAYRARGTLDEWRRLIARLTPYPVAQAVLATAFAAPLLDPLGLTSFTVDVSARTSLGKSSALWAAASVHVDPADTSRGIGTWNTSPTAIEGRLSLVNGLASFLDETQVVPARFPDLVPRMLYEVSQNRGAARGGDNPSEVPWRTILVATGERPALSFRAGGGAAARTLSLRTAPFGAESPTNGAAARAVKTGVEQVYGTAGPAYIARLRHILAAPDGTDRLRRRHAALTADHSVAADGTPVGAVASRRAPLIAALQLAAELAAELDIMPFEAPPTETWREMFVGEASRDDQGAMALEVVRGYVASHAHQVWTPEQDLRLAPSGGWIGGRIILNGDPVVALLPEPLRHELDRCGYVLEAVREAWRETNTIRLDAKRQLDRVRLMGKQLRAYVFTAAVLDGDAEQVLNDHPDTPGAQGAPPPSPLPSVCNDCGFPRDSNGHDAHCGTGTVA